MPNGSSIDLIELLQRDVPDTRVVVLTMGTNPLFARQAINAGAAGFVRKDRTDTELPRAVSGNP